MSQLESFSRPPRGSDLVTDDGEPMESARHRQQMTLLIQSLEAAWHERYDFYVGGNMFVYFSEAQVRHNDFRGPDVFVVLDTDRHERKAWVVWEEGGKGPDVVIELLSDSTRDVDRGEKKRIYERVLNVSEYFLFDPFSLELEGFDLSSGIYVSKAPDSGGRLFSKRLGLWLGLRRGSFEGVEADWLRWFDEVGQLLKSPAEFGQEAAQRAEQEAQRAEQEAQRAEQEAQRAEQEAQRAEQEAQRAEQEAQRAEQAEARVRELETELAKRS